MRAKDKRLLERLRHSIRDDRLLDRLISRLEELNDDECSGFVEYLASTFPPHEFTSVIEYFVELPHAQWKKIARGRTGDDAFDHKGKLTGIIDNLLSCDSSSHTSETSEEATIKAIEFSELFRMLRSWDLGSFGLTDNQDLIVRLLIFVFDGSYAETAAFLGMRRQSVRETAHAAFKKIEKKLRNI